jgi:hypothetical protein
MVLKWPRFEYYIVVWMITELALGILASSSIPIHVWMQKHAIETPPSRAAKKGSRPCTDLVEGVHGKGSSTSSGSLTALRSGELNSDVHGVLISAAGRA